MPIITDCAKKRDVPSVQVNETNATPESDTTSNMPAKNHQPYAHTKAAIPFANVLAPLPWIARSRVLLPLVAITLGAITAVAQTTPTTPSPYDFRDEIYVGGNYTRASTGLERNGANFGGWQAGSTHYFTPVWGLAFDALGIYGNAPHSAAFNAFSEPLVRKHYFMAGPQIRWRRGNRWASSLRLVAGVSNTSTGSLDPMVTPTDLGLYPNATKFAFRPGTTLDYNISPRLALRSSNGALIERQDGRLKGQFSTSLGLLFRFGNRADATSSGQSTPAPRP